MARGGRFRSASPRDRRHRAARPRPPSRRGRGCRDRSRSLARGVAPGPIVVRPEWFSKPTIVVRGPSKIGSVRCATTGPTSRPGLAVGSNVRGSRVRAGSASRVPVLGPEALVATAHGQQRGAVADPAGDPVADPGQAPLDRQLVAVLAAADDEQVGCRQLDDVSEKRRHLDGDAASPGPDDQRLRTLPVSP